MPRSVVVPSIILRKAANDLIAWLIPLSQGLPYLAAALSPKHDLGRRFGLRQSRRGPLRSSRPATRRTSERPGALAGIPAVYPGRDTIFRFAWDNGISCGRRAEPTL